MKIYVLGNLLANPTLQHRYRQIAATLARAGAAVLTNFDPVLPVDDVTPVLERVDAVVIEGTLPTAEAGHLIALAVTYHKPVLYLTEGGVAVDRHLLKLSHNTAVLPWLRLQSYAVAHLPRHLANFLRDVEHDGATAGPTVKFTLRLTPAISRYLTCKAKVAKKTRADFLREFLGQLMARDESYQPVSQPPPSADSPSSN